MFIRRGENKLQWFQIWHFYWSFSEWRSSKHGSERLRLTLSKQMWGECQPTLRILPEACLGWIGHQQVSVHHWTGGAEMAPSPLCIRALVLDLCHVLWTHGNHLVEVCGLCVWSQGKLSDVWRERQTCEAGGHPLAARGLWCGEGKRSKSDDEERTMTWNESGFCFDVGCHENDCGSMIHAAFLEWMIGFFSLELVTWTEEFCSFSCLVSVTSLCWVTLTCPGQVTCTCCCPEILCSLSLVIWIYCLVIVIFFLVNAIFCLEIAIFQHLVTLTCLFLVTEVSVLGILLLVTMTDEVLWNDLESKSVDVV